MINIALRLSVLVSKFFFIFLAAKYLSLSDMGEYGIFIASVTYSIYLIGFDFYTFSNRAFIQSESEQALIASKQLSFNLLSLSLVTIPFLLLFFLDVFSVDILLIFCMVVISEYLGQEIGRLLIASGRVIAASWTLFIRSALWSYIVVFLMVFNPDYISLKVILGFWLLSSWLALFIGVYYLRDIFSLAPFKFNIDSKWIFRGINISIILFFGTLLARAVFTGDRLILELLGHKELVGIYAVYVGLCNVFMTFADSAVFQFSYPKQIKNFKNKNMHAILNQMKKDAVAIVFVYILIISGYYVLLEFLFSYIGKQEYLNYINYFWGLLIAYFFIVISYIPHYVIYAANEDRKILKTHFFQFLVFFVSVFGLYVATDINVFMNIVLAMLLSSVITFLSKAFYCYQVLK
ncbi:lipopolysaccharide biosynthesis protein [Pseudoalteromonas sp. PAB 2.2]|uniref:lipopolysaccharide biosynthesis protein n=1 Tax=Pseudoalteromonas sp. PAB 2.2 TaxID=1841508 RepID=UPI000A72927D|nr:hypothetical protein [Pseudoalteromonas sp. PAB 2.2]